MECRFQHPGYIPGGLSFETTWSHVEKVSTGKSQTTNNLYQKLKVKNITFRREDFWTTEMPSREMVKSLNPPKKRTGLRFLLHWNFASFIFAKIPVNYLPAESLTPREGQDLETCKSRTECGNGWFLMHCQKQGEFLKNPGCVAWVFQDLFLQSCGAISPT